MLIESFHKYQVEFNHSTNIFQLVAKRIIKEKLSTEQSTLKQYEVDIIEAHDKIISFIRKIYLKLTHENQLKFRQELIYIRHKITICLIVN